MVNSFIAQVKSVFKHEGEQEPSKELKEESRPVEEKLSQGFKDFTQQSEGQSVGEKFKEKIHLMSDKFRYGVGEVQLGYENLSSKLRKTLGS